MYWNYRVLHDTDPDGDPRFSIAEVYYTDDDKLMGYTDPAYVSDSSMEDLREILDKMRHALEKPVLTPGDFKKD